MVQSKSDTKINLYGLFNTEAAIVQATPQKLQTVLDGAAGTDLGIVRWITEIADGRWVVRTHASLACAAG